MENISNVCNTNSTKILLIILLTASLVCMLFTIFNQPKPHEGFSCDQEQQNLPIDYSQKDPLIQPTSYDANTYSIQTGNDFIKQKQIFIPPWGQGIGDDIVIEDNDKTDYTLNNVQCSIHCCSDQWPVPFEMPMDKSLCIDKKELVPSSYYCNNGYQNSGCLCLTGKQAKLLGTRGLNAN